MSAAAWLVASCRGAGGAGPGGEAASSNGGAGGAGAGAGGAGAADPTATAGAADAPDLALDAAVEVSWGYGCGGHCAQNTRGGSHLVVAAMVGEVQVEDAGQSHTTHSAPGSMTTETRTWDNAWRGTIQREANQLTLRLTGERARCETGEDRGQGAKKAPCAHPAPAELVLRCTRGEVEIEGAGRRAAWTCTPDPAIPEESWSGTAFPWVFGIDAPIDTVVVGEPIPRTHHRLRAR